MSLLALQAALMAGEGTSGALSATAEATEWAEGGGEISFAYFSIALCTPSGGTAPYAYLWEIVSGTAEFGGSPSSPEMIFGSATGAASSVRCKVTDQNEISVYSNTVDIT